MRLFYLIPVFLCLTISMTSEAMAEQDRDISWKTEKMKLLESNEFFNAYKDALKSKSEEEINNAKELTQEDLAKFSADTVNILISELATDKGVQVETVYATLGALIGFSAQMVIHEQFIASGQISEKDAFMLVETKDNQKYYFGNAINAILFESQQAATPWKILEDTILAQGATDLPKPAELSEWSASTVGTKEFGIPRVSKNHYPQRMPKELLNEFWHPIRMSMANKEPAKWPIMLSMAGVAMLTQTKEVIDPAIAFQIMVESAVAMSRVDPQTIYKPYLLKEVKD